MVEFALGSRGVHSERGWSEECDAFWCIFKSIPVSDVRSFFNFGIHIVVAFATVLSLHWNCLRCGASSELYFGRILF